MPGDSETEGVQETLRVLNLVPSRTSNGCQTRKEGVETQTPIQGSVPHSRALLSWLMQTLAFQRRKKVLSLPDLGIQKH